MVLERIKTFFKEVLTEGKKVNWPTRQDVFKYTIIVISISVSVAIFLGVLDFVFLKILAKILV